MNKIKKIVWIRNLMLLSQVLLLVFVVQWLNSQYNEEKRNLVKDLTLQFTTSKQAVMDSMIVFKLINPLLKDAKGFKVHMEMDDQNNPSRKIITTDEIRTTKFITSNEDSCKLMDTLPLKYNKVITLKHSGDMKKDVLLNGVKLMYKEVSSLSDDTLENVNTFFYSTDTVLLKKLFANNINKSGLQLKYAWVNNKPKDSILNNKSKIYIESNLFPNSYGLEISQYDPYLLKKVSPQIFFAIILLILTGSAFLLAYNSLKNQIRLSDLRNDFISNISHELKTPVSTVKVAIEALQDFDRKHDPKVVTEYLNMAAIEMNRLDTLIDKVMNTSILEEGEKLIYLESTDLKQLITETLDELKLRFASVNATVKFESNIENAISLLDKVHIRGVLVNLIDNSLKYGNEHPQIGITLNKNNNEYIVSIKDNGPGIPEEYKDKIFDKFFRVPKGNLHDIKGYGLGLSYCKLIMQQHNRNITVRNLNEGGCIFTLHFPI